MRCACIFLSLVSVSVYADMDVQISGFGTLGAVTSDSDQYGWRDDFSKSDGVYSGDIDFAQTSKLGIQTDIVFNDQFNFVAQAVYRDQDSLTLDNALNLAFINYTPSANWSFRLGRVGYDLFLLTEYRDIDFSYAWAHVPTEVYGVVPYRFIDGFDLSYTYRTENGSLTTKLFAGDSEASFAGYTDPDVNTVENRKIRGITLDYSTMEWEIGANLSRSEVYTGGLEPLIEGANFLINSVPKPVIDFVFPNAASIVAQTNLDNVDAQYLSINGRLMQPSYTLMAELSATEADTLIIPDVTAGYVSFEYYINEYTYFVSYAQTSADGTEIEDFNIQTDILYTFPGGQLIYESLSALYDFYKVGQKTYSVGVRWDYNEHVSFKAQLDRTRLNDGGSTLFQREALILAGDLPAATVHTLFLNTSFVF